MSYFLGQSEGLVKVYSGSCSSPRIGTVCHGGLTVSGACRGTEPVTRIFEFTGVFRNFSGICSPWLPMVTLLTQRSRQNAMMKTILLPFYDDPAAESALGQSCVIAERFGSHIEGLFVMRPPQIIEAEGIALAGAYITQLKEEWRRRADSARERFFELVAARGVPIRAMSDPSSGPSASWHEVEGPEGQVVGEHGRLFDLVVIGRTSEQALIDWQVMCEAVLFESGRPALIAAPEVPECIGSRILIHWNGSTEVARTISFARPFLGGAVTVTVLTVTDAIVPGPSGDQITTHLRRGGINAQSVNIESAGRGAGEVIMEETRKRGIDLLIKGAYTHNRLRQMVFGGASRHILTNADRPALMAH